MVGIPVSFPFGARPIFRCEVLVSGSVTHEKVMKGLHERLPSRKRSHIPPNWKFGKSRSKGAGWDGDMWSFPGGYVGDETFACTEKISFHSRVVFFCFCVSFVYLHARCIEILPPPWFGQLNLNTVPWKKSANQPGVVVMDSWHFCHLDLRPMKAMFRWWICCWLLSPSGEGGFLQREGRMDYFFEEKIRNMSTGNILLLLLLLLLLFINYIGKPYQKSIYTCICRKISFGHHSH